MAQTLNTDLERLATAFAPLLEAGRVLSASNKTLVARIKELSADLPDHGVKAKIGDLLDQLLASAEGQVEESCPLSAEDVQWLTEATFTAEERRDLAKRGLAMPDGSFPIRNAADLSNAISAYGRSPDQATKNWIIKRARALGKVSSLPEAWNVKEAAPSEPSEASPGAILEADAEDTPAGKCPQCGTPVDADDSYCPNCGAKLGTAAGKGMQETAEKPGRMRPKSSAPAAMHLRESCRILEAVAGSQGKEWDVLVIQTGLSKNGNLYPAETLKRATKLFEGVSAFADHATDDQRRSQPERSIRDKVGVFRRPEFGSWDVGNGEMVEGIKARFKVVDPGLRQKMLEAVDLGEPDFYGFSIDGSGALERQRQGARMVNRVNEITKIHSADVVTDAAAGGRVVRLVASTGNPGNNQALELEGDNEMDPEALAALIKEQIATVLQESVGAAVKGAVASALPQDVVERMAKLEAENKAAKQTALVEAQLAQATGLTDLSKAELRESFAGREMDEETIKGAVTRRQEYEAKLLEAHKVRLGQQQGVHIQMGYDDWDKKDLALKGFFSNADEEGVPRYRSLKEAYCRWKGLDYYDVDPFQLMRDFSTKFDSHIDHKPIRESLSTASWANIYADHLYLRMLKVYAALPYATMWQPFVSEMESVPDFQTRHWERIGGYGDLNVVGQGATYPLLTTPTDEEVTYSISKRGGLDDVTFEAITNDRFNAVQRIPGGMARAAARTLYKFVMNMITTDNAVQAYDSVALYAAGHNNTDTTALSVSALNKARYNMRLQTAFGESSEILGMRNVPKHLIVPAALEGVATRILNPSDAYAFALSSTPDADASVDPQEFKGSGIQMHVYDQLSSTTGWYLMADPNEVETVIMGFLNGAREPELFVQDSPTVGSNFTADKVTFKTRFLFGGCIADFRGMYRGNT